MPSVPRHQLSEPEDAQAPLLARRNPLSTEQAALRTTAYVYGNILVLASLVALYPDDVETGRGLSIILGAALSTFIAHVFAEMLGHQVRAPEPLTWSSASGQARNSFPILSSGLVPTGIAVLGWLTAVSGDFALAVAEAVVLLRIAATGVVIARLRNERSSRRLLLIGVLAAVVGGLISFLKAVLTH